MSAETRGLTGGRMAPGATLGIVAGGGALPGILADSCARENIPTFIIAFDGRTDPALLAARPHLVTRPGRAGLMIRTFRNHGIRDIVLIGALHRPSLLELRPDWLAFRFCLSVMRRALGDDGFLKALRREIEKYGFRLYGVQEFVPDLLGRAGALGARTPDAGDRASITLGLQASQELGRRDIGQAVIVHEGTVIGREDKKGTNALMRRCAGKPGAILVKTCKPGQDRAIDMPTIGVRTVEVAAAAGVKGIVYEAGATLVPDAAHVAQVADAAGLFVFGAEVAHV